MDRAMREPEPVQTRTLAKRPDTDDVLVKEAAAKELGPAAQLANHAKALVVNSESSLTGANTLLGNLKVARERLTEQRTFFTKPLREHVKRIEVLFSPVLKQLEEADEGLRGKVVNFIDDRREQAARAAEELTAKANAAAEKGQAAKAATLALKSVETVEAASVRTMVTDTGSTSTRQVDDFEILDMGAVPKEYLTLDEKSVRAAMRSGVTTIPGLRIFKRTQLAVTAASA